MKISCLGENLSKALNIVSKLVSTKSSLEILSHILISTDKGRLKLSATNLEIGINYKIGAKIESEGSISVPARLFTELVSQLPEGKVEILIEKNSLFINSKNYNSKINGLSAEEFPLIPKIKNKKSFSVSGKKLKEAILMVSFASAFDEVRPVLAGVYMDIKKDKIFLVATDSYRLAEKVINISGNIEEKNFIIPSRSLVELSRIIGDYEGVVNVYANENQVMFETDDFEFTSRLIEGNFPDYKQIIPTVKETKVTLKVSDFIRIIKVAALFSGESVGSVNIEISTKGTVKTKSASSQFGESSAFCDAKVEGKEIEIVFNSKYILDVLPNLKKEELEFEANGKLNPGIIKSVGDDSYVYVIMPLRA